MCQNFPPLEQQSKRFQSRVTTSTKVTWSNDNGLFAFALQHTFYASTTGKTGPFLQNHLSLITATLVTLGLFALGTVFVCFSLNK